MGRLIDAEEIEELFCEVISGIAKKPEMTRDLEHMVRASAMVIEMLRDAPTVGADPVVRGEWIEENTRPRSGMFYCSSCHRTCYDLQPTRLKGWTKRCRYSFCPNCGADMRKGGDDD